MRRTWMLLLVIALLAIFLAVPAMAAEHTDHTGWSELAAGTITADGNYTVPANFNGSVTVNGEVTVTICLNGQTWDCSAGTTRPLKVQGGATVTLCDCQETAGTIKGANVGEETTGGSIYIDDNCEVSIHDITITGGKAKEGGNIYAYGTGSTLRFVSGLITLGEATVNSGGNINAKGELHVGYEGGSLTDTVISKGKTTTSGSSSNAGNVMFSSAGTFYMYSGHITEGDAINAGGNIQLGSSATFRMSGGLIDLGICRGSNGHSQNFFNNNGATMYLSGGEIRGYVSHSGANSKLYMSGSGSIVKEETKPTEGKQDSYTGLRMVDTGTIVIEDPANYTGTLVLAYTSCQTDGLLRIACNSDNYLDFIELIENKQLTVNATTRLLGANPTGVYQMVGSSSASSTLRKSCMCGYTKTGDDKPDYSSHDNEGHASWCDKVNTVWLPFTSSSANGYFYLTADTNRGQIYNSAGNSVYAVDLNGHTLTNSAAGRRYRLVKGDSLSITDTSAAQTGVMEAAPAHGDQAGVIWISTSTDANNPITVNIYAGTLRQHATVTTKACYGGIIGGGGAYANITMHGGAITDGHAFDDVAFDSLWNDADGDGKVDTGEYAGSDSDKGAGLGGNLYVCRGMVFTMKGGTISGGTAVRGGNIYMAGGTFILDGGTISGGTLDNTIYNADGTVYEGTVYTESVDTSAITEGSSNTNTTTKAGSSVYIADGTFTLKSGTITDGEVCLYTGEVITVEDSFSTATPINVTMETVNTAFTAGISNADRAATAMSCFDLTNECHIGINNAYQLYAYTADAYGASVEGYSFSFGLTSAIETAAGKVVTLNTHYKYAFTVGCDALIDLNGYTLGASGKNITIMPGATLKLADSTAVDYKEGTGKVAGDIVYKDDENGNVGKIARDFITGKGGLVGKDGNYRFLVIKDSETGAYTSHRIYMAVVSTVLVPDYQGSPAVKYRTRLKCDATVQSYISDYGVETLRDDDLDGVAENSAKASYTNEGITITAGEVSEHITGMTQLYGEGIDKGENNYSARVYITLTDDLKGDVVSANSTKHTEKTLKSMVELADASWDSLSEAAQGAMQRMVKTWGSKMTAWTLNMDHYPSEN